jgi:hypothetical protein
VLSGHTYTILSPRNDDLNAATFPCAGASLAEATAALESMQFELSALEEEKLAAQTRADELAAELHNLKEIR